MTAIYGPVVHSVGDVWAPAGSVLGPRTIEDYELVYFPDGTAARYEIGGAALRMDSPCFVFTRPGESHRYVFDPERNVRHLYVHFDYAALREAEPRFETLLRPGTSLLPVSSNSLLPSLLKQMLRIAHFQSPHWKRRLSALLAAAVEELCASADHALEELARTLPLPISRAIAYIEAHLEQPITIEAIARESGWSHEHFTRMFVASVGMSPKRALLERRLMRAEQLMMSGEWTVKQVAYRVGFGDEHHFSKMYKRLRGLTPTDYIKRCENALFRHATAVFDRDAEYGTNRQILVDGPIK